MVAKEEAKVVDIASFHPHPRAEFSMLKPRAHNLEKLQPYIESGKLKAVNVQRDEEFGESHLKVNHNVDGVLATDANFGIDNVPMEKHLV